MFDAADVELSLAKTIIGHERTTISVRQTLIFKILSIPEPPKCNKPFKYFTIWVILSNLTSLAWNIQFVKGIIFPEQLFLSHGS